jgi:Xaa-Pro aminopeptidase
MYPHQAERLTEVLDRHRLEALIASSEPNVTYLTGFRGVSHTVLETPQLAVFSRHGTALVVASGEAAAVVTDGIEVDHVVAFGGVPDAYAERPDAGVKRIRELVEASAPNATDALAAALATLGVRDGAVGLDEGRITPATWQRIATRLTGPTLVPAADHFLSARRVKGPWEIERLHLSLGAAEEALNEVIAKIAPGMTEREAVTLFQSEVIKRGAEPVPATITTGARTWIPFTRATDRALRPHEIVRFDVGCVVDGYHARVARTAVAGALGDRLDATYRAVQAALEAAIDAVKPGVAAACIHAAALAAAHEAGLGSFAASRVGCGVGLAPSEMPDLAHGVETPLETGEVLTIDVRHFEMGWAGVHVRDTVLVTSGGARSMNRSSHGLVVLD